MNINFVHLCAVSY